MKLKISLKTGSRDEAVNLGKKILKDVNGPHGDSVKSLHPT